MAEVEAAEGSLLQRKLGPMPVWVWALVGLAAAWLYSKYRSNQAASTTDTTGANSSESAATAPEFIIEENLPSVPGGTTSPGGGTPSGPVVTPPGKPVTTPGGTSGKPPLHGGRPPVPVGAAGGKTKGKADVYRVQPGDTLSSIAQAHHTTWQKLFAYNTTAGNRDAATIKTLKARGPNKIFAGEEILIPQ